MAMQTNTLLGVGLIVVPVALASGQRPPRLDGTWRAKTADGPQTVIVRADSSASWGDETVRWRVDTLFIKEPITIKWIEGFKEGEILYDVGANM